MERVRKNSYPSPSPSSSSSTFSSLSQAFPMSWFSKFKHMGHRTKQKNKPHSPLNSPLPLNSQNHAKHFIREEVYNDDDSYWQLSFGGGSPQGVGGSGFYDYHHMSSCRGCKASVMKATKKEDNGKFSGMVCNVRKMKISGREAVPRRVKKGRKTNKISRRDFEEFSSNSGEESIDVSQEIVPRNDLDLELLKTFQKLEKDYLCSKAFGSTNSGSKERRNKKEDGFEKLEVVEEEEEVGSEENAVEEVKMKRLHSKSEKQRKSVYINREPHKRRAKQSCRVKVHSPRTPSKVEICRIRALEDMRKEKVKKKQIDKGLDLEEFAVVKCSFDPEKDFRDSMMEMIEENNMKGAEELEKLLACYLSLNSDEYHNVIVKAFRQVWLGMNQLHLQFKSQIREPR